MKNKERLKEVLSECRMFGLDEFNGYNVSYGLYDLIKENLNQNSIVVEIGSYAGVSTEVFALNCKTVYAVDPWVGYSEIATDLVSEAERRFDERMKTYDNVIKVKKTSLDAAKDFEDGSLDCIYIDGEHTFESIYKDIKTWMPKIKNGGILCGHDYTHIDRVQNAVHMFFNKEELTTYSDSSFMVKINRKKKLLFVIPHLSTGGLPQYVVKKTEMMIDDYDIYVVEYSNVTGGRLVVQRNRLINLLKTELMTLGDNKFELLDIIDRIKPDIIHMEEIPEMFCDFELAKKIYKNDRRYVIYETSHDSSYNINNKQFLPEKFIFVSNYQKKTFEPLGIDIEVIDYPIEFSDRKNREQYRKELGLDPSKKHILNVGLFTPRKNQKEFFEYARKMPQYQFHQVGNMADNFKFYWEPLLKDVPSNLKIWDERSDVYKFFEAMDLFLFTSRGTVTDKETMPLVLKEAISAKIPICLYNLPVYENFFNQFNDIYYLNFTDMEENIKIINDVLTSNTTINNPAIFYTQDGLIDFSKYEYENSMYGTIQKYGSNAGMYWGQFIFKELDRFGVTVDSGDVFVDLGANIGMSARYAEMKGASEIHCFEPDINILELLKKNMPNVKTYHYAIGNEKKSIELYHWPYNIVDTGPKYIIEMVTLKDIIEIIGKPIDYLKMDIEGFEDTLFDNLSIKDLYNVKKIFIEHHIPDKFEQFCDKLINFGFEISKEYGSGQNYVYGTNKNFLQKNINSNFSSILYKDEQEMQYNVDKVIVLPNFLLDDIKPSFFSNWSWSEQKMEFSVNKTTNFPILISIKEYKSDAVLWAAKYDNLVEGCNYWIIPISKQTMDYETSDIISGVKICIYKLDTNIQLYEFPYFKKFIDIPTISLSNTAPYHMNYREYFVEKKYDKFFKNKKFDNVIDVGANVGVFTSYILYNKLSKKVICVECDSVALLDLKNNFDINPNVDIIDKALYWKNEKIEFYESKDNCIVSGILPQEKLKTYLAGNRNLNKIEVDTITIKDLIDKVGTIDLLKIDIEGAEYEILENTKTEDLLKINNFFIECHYFEENYKEKYNNLIKRLENIGFSVEEYAANQSDGAGASEAIFVTRRN